MKTVVIRQTIRTAWLFYSAIILLAFVAGCTLSTPLESDDTVDSTSEATTTTEVEISLAGIAAQSRSTTVWALNTDFAVNMQTMYVVITAPDFAERREEMSLETGKVMLTVTAGVDRTFKIEAHNQSGMIVYESAPRTLDVVAGTPLSIDIEIDPVELRLPLLSVTQANLEQELTVAITDPDSPLHGLRVSVPANATDQAVTVEVAEVYNPSHITLPELQAGVIVELQPKGVTFAPPVTVEFPYNDPLLHVLGIDEATLRINSFDAVTGQWVPVANQSVDTERNLIVAQLDRFSFFVITYEPAGDSSSDPTPTTDQAPVVANPGPQTTVVETTVSLAIQATDVDGDELTYSATGLPNGLSIDATTGRITGTVATSAADSSPFTVTITVSDGTHSTRAVFAWEVSTSSNPDPNPQSKQPPVLSPLADRSSAEGNTVHFLAQATDADGDRLQFSASGLPLGVTLDTDTGGIAGTVSNTASVSSPYTVTIAVSDRTASVQTSFTWTITNPEPVVTWPGDQQHADGASVSLQVNASDADNDTLIYTASNLPPGLSMNSGTGLISGVLSNAASTSSPYLVMVTVSDGVAESSSTFTWQIDPAVSPQTLLVTWEAPTKNADGSDLTDLSSYRLYYGLTSRGAATTPGEFTYESSVDINDAAATSFSLPAPDPGETYYFSLTAIDTSGNESDFSEEASLDIS